MAITALIAAFLLLTALVAPLVAGRDRTARFVEAVRTRIVPRARLGIFGPSADRLLRDTHALINVGPVFAIIGVVIAGILAFIVIGALVAPFLSATESVTENFSTGDTGNTDANTLLTALGPVIPIIAVVVLFGMILAAFTLRD